MPVLSIIKSVATGLLLFAGVSQAGYSPDSKSNVVVYWGQGPYQKPLGHFCTQDSIDVVVLSFVHKFSASGFSFDFGNACGSGTCPQIANDIRICQSNGKKVLLSMGGYVASYSINGKGEGETVANMIYGAFGPRSSSSISRPFGDVVVDGIDLDIEAPSADGQVGFIEMVNKLRSLSAGRWLIAGAPQAAVPDANMGHMIQGAKFDMIFIQFYNTFGVSARDWVEGRGLPYDTFTESIGNGASSGAKVYIGLPGGPDAANPGFYLEPEEADRLIKAFTGRPNFGGVMLWEATQSENNGKYHQSIKSSLLRHAEPRAAFKELEILELATTVLDTPTAVLCGRSEPSEDCTSVPAEDTTISVITSTHTLVTVAEILTGGPLSGTAHNSVNTATSTASLAQSSTAFTMLVKPTNTSKSTPTSKSTNTSRSTNTSKPTSTSSEATDNKHSYSSSVKTSSASSAFTTPSVIVAKETRLVVAPSNKSDNLSSSTNVGLAQLPVSKATRTLAGAALVGFCLAVALWV